MSQCRQRQGFEERRNTNSMLSRRSYSRTATTLKHPLNTTKKREITVLDGIKLEEERIQLEKHERSKIKELVKLRKKHAKQLKKWMGKDRDFGEKCQTIQRVDRTILPLLQASENTNDDLIKQYDQSIDELTHVYKSISKKGQSPTLKSRLDEEHSNVERTNKKLTELKKKQTQLEKEKDEVKLKLTTPTLNQSKRDDLKRTKQDLSAQLKNINRDIQIASKNYGEATESYEKNSNIILNASQQDEKTRLQSMKSVLQNFINALKRSSSSASATTRHIVPVKNSFQAGKQYSSSLTGTDDESDEDEDENHYENINDGKSDDESDEFDDENDEDEDENHYENINDGKNDDEYGEPV